MSMVSVSSPFATKRIFSWAVEVIAVDRKRSSNHFFWDVVIHNSPGVASYDTTMPRLYRWGSIGGVISAAYKTYVDNLRSISAIQSLAKKATHHVGNTMGHRCELPDNYPVFVMVMVIYHYVERIWIILITPNFCITYTI